MRSAHNPPVASGAAACRLTPTRPQTAGRGLNSRFPVAGARVRIPSVLHDVHAVPRWPALAHLQPLRTMLGTVTEPGNCDRFKTSFLFCLHPVASGEEGGEPKGRNHANGTAGGLRRPVSMRTAFSTFWAAGLACAARVGALGELDKCTVVQDVIRSDGPVQWATRAAAAAAVVDVGGPFARSTYCSVVSGHCTCFLRRRSDGCSRWGSRGERRALGERRSRGWVRSIIR